MWKKVIGWGVVIIVAAAVILPKVLIKQPFTEGVAAPVVEVVSPEQKDIVNHTALVGSVEPESMVYIYPKQSGDVTEVKVKTGDIVQKDQVLYVIDTRQIESAKNSLDSAELSLSQARDELSRQSVLYAGGGISEQSYQQYQNSVKSAQIAYENAKTNYEYQVSYSQITAPITGVIESSNIEAYDVVSTNDVVCVISGENGKVISFSVTERIKNVLKEGDTIVVEKDGNEFDGTIYEISSMTDASTGLFSIKARIDENLDQESLPTGSKVKLAVISEQAQNVMTVPLNSVYYDGGLSYVYTYNQDAGIIHKVMVETGLSDDESMEIISGISAADQVLITWSSELYEGAAVRIKGQESSQPAE